MSAPSTRRILFACGKWVVLAVLLALIVAGIFLVRFQPNAPKFIRNPALKGPHLNLRYPFLDPIPFSEGLTWVGTHSSTNDFHIWVLNVETGDVLGEIRNGDPLAIDGQRQQVLCNGIKAPRSALQRNFYKIIEKVTGRSPPAGTDESYWILDLRTGRATAIGHAPKPKMPSSTISSPAFSYAYLLDAHHATDRSDLFLFDLAGKKLERCQVPDWPLGWWSDEEILFKIPDGGFGAYDPATQMKRTLVSDTELTDWLNENAIDLEAQKVGTFPVWNGKAYDHYVTDTHTKWLAESSFLAKLGPDGKPSLLKKDFKFGWSDHLHPNQMHYTYTGRESGGNSSAVFVRDLRSGADKMIVPSDSAYFSIPRPYKDWVIFVRSNMLWKAELSGSNIVRLFPPGK